jgi:hypothetical protein
MRANDPPARVERRSRRNGFRQQPIALHFSPSRTTIAAMRSNEDHGTLPVSLARYVDQACDRFEAAWIAGQRPCLEDFLDVPEPARPAAVRELILLDGHYRRLAGEEPQVADYQARFPELDPVWLADAVAARSDTQPRSRLPRGMIPALPLKTTRPRAPGAFAVPSAKIPFSSATTMARRSCVRGAAARFSPAVRFGRAEVYSLTEHHRGGQTPGRSGCRWASRGRLLTESHHGQPPAPAARVHAH